MINTKWSEILLQLLKAVKQFGPEDKSSGICRAIEDIAWSCGIPLKDIRLLLTLFRGVVEEWSEFSGDINYPVSIEDWDAAELYCSHYQSNKSMWDPNTAYGAARLRLLDFAIKHIEENLPK